MAEVNSVDFARLVRENLEQASPDLLREMVQVFADIAIPKSTHS